MFAFLVAMFHFEIKTSWESLCTQQQQKYQVMKQQASPLCLLPEKIKFQFHHGSLLINIRNLNSQGIFYILPFDMKDGDW